MTMHSRWQDGPAEQTQIARKIVHGDAAICTAPAFSVAWKAIFPRKAAEQLAVMTGQSLRACAYQLSGEHEISAAPHAALSWLTSPLGRKQYEAMRKG